MFQKFEQSEKNLTDEIDLVNIINSIRQLKIALKAVLTENQLKIIEFANYRCASENHFKKKSLIETIIEADANMRFEILCNQLNHDNGTVSGLSSKIFYTKF